MVTEVVFIRVGSLSAIGPAQFFFSGVCVFGGGAGHITADDWCVCERGVSENVMIGWSIVCQPKEWKALYQSSAGVHTQAHAQLHTPTTSPGVSARASPTIS